MARSKGHLKWPDDGPNHFSIFAFLTTFSQKNDKKGPREEKNSISWKSAFEIGAKFEIYFFPRRTSFNASQCDQMFKLKSSPIFEK